jgi:hypothetical protein
MGGLVSTLAGSGNPGSADGVGTAASFLNPRGVAVILSRSTIVLADYGNSIRLVTYPAGVVTTLAGGGSASFADGKGAAARFSQPYGVAVLPSDVIVVADLQNRRLRLVTLSGDVTTLAGSSSLEAGGSPPSLLALAVIPFSNTIVFSICVLD